MADPMAVLNSVLAIRREVGAYLAGHAWEIAAAIAFTGAAWAAGTGWWRRTATAALTDRVGYELLPASTFEAGPIEVRWFAGQLASVPAASGALPRRASASRVRITCEENRLHFLLEGPGRAQSLLRMPGYQDVEVVSAAVRGRAAQVSRIRFEGARPSAGGVR
jgi:hypothetical protein